MHDFAVEGEFDELGFGWFGVTLLHVDRWLRGLLTTHRCSCNGGGNEMLLARSRGRGCRCLKMGY
jgi:hypothetical protein